MHAQYAADTTDDTAGHATDDTTNSRTNRTGCASTLGRTALAAAHDALGLCNERH
ncbi:hypothetical protein [Bradyrhizobium sp. dw_78]|uniref:hypothetical protein n=1 Tax=Bradyrhizobium sp. dw_78 TaxID=2719793 RepID=UPI001BD5B14B|nr:hypothetical protein [Bradyrhizobium sp. dw_78]